MQSNPGRFLSGFFYAVDCRRLKGVYFLIFRPLFKKQSFFTDE
jgi:hypothetical protein